MLRKTAREAMPLSPLYLFPLFLRSLQIDGDELAFVEEFKGDARPAVGPDRARGVILFAQLQAGKAEDDGLPDRATGGQVDALCRVQARILQVDQRALEKEVVGMLRQAQFAGQ